MLILQAIYAILCVGMAYSDAWLIKRDKPVNHTLNACAHVACWIVGAFFGGWVLLIIMPFIGRLVFDVSLALFRRLPIGYVSAWVKERRPGASAVDKLEFRVFGDGIRPKALYLAIIITINLLIWL